jgi:hypothetical protein
MELGKLQLEVEFRLDLEDFLETIRTRESRSRKLTRLILMTIGTTLVAVLLATPFLMRDVPGFLAAFLLGVLPLAVLMVILPWYYKPDRFYRSYYGTFVFNNCRTEVAEEGIRVSTDSTESMLLWKGLSGYAETKTQLVLTAGMVQYIFPKRLIEQSVFAELVALVKTKTRPTNK